VSNLVIAWNASKIQELMELPIHPCSGLSMDDIAAVRPVFTTHINFKGVLHFPLAEFAEPIPQAPVQIPATP
jgi:hypothetical protein